MSDYQVKWIIPDGNDADRRIDAIGGDGFCHRLDDAIYNIQRGIHSFYVQNGFYRVNVIVASRNGRLYLKTENDGLEPNNLLSLPHRRWAA